MKKIYPYVLSLLLAIPAIVQGSVTVISPNGGENWITGCPNTIQWINSNLTPVKIELYKNGVFYLTICNLVPVTQNSYIWSPPASVIPGNTFKVKITSLTNSNPGFDFSDANFSINQGTITVVSPNGGEIWQIGSTCQILWTDNICDNVRMELWKGGAFNTLISSSAPSTGLFTWTIPVNTTIIPGSNYKIKIMSVAINSGSTNMIYDFSNNYFTITQGYFITVTSPNGGEVWARGTTHIITWLDNIPWNVRIELWKGGVYNSLISASAPSNGSCYWAIPATQPSGIDYKVKIMAISPTNSNLIFDFSDNNFSILGSNTGPSVKISTPEGSLAKEMKIFPNPCNNLLKMTIPGNTFSSGAIEMMNMNGKIILRDIVQGSPDTETYDINTTSLADGMYIFVIRNDQEVVYRTPVVIRH
jgi:hypothetical protein